MYSTAYIDGWQIKIKTSMKCFSKVLVHREPTEPFSSP